MSSEADKSERVVESTMRTLHASRFVIPLGLVAAHLAYLISNIEPIRAQYAKDATVSVNWYATLMLSGSYLMAVVASLPRKGKRETTVAEGKELAAAGGESRAAITEAMLVYNVYMTLVSFVMFAGMVHEVVSLDTWRWWNVRDTSPKGSWLAYLLWVNFVTKPTEFVDTYFMLVKGNFRQVTWLHISHHAVMPINMTILLQMYPGGNSYFGPCLNSFIHTIMYAYYAASGLGIRCPWKKYITALQLIQFVAVLGQNVFCLWTGDAYWPRINSWLCTALMFQMITMFTNFAIQAYCPRRKARGKEGSVAAVAGVGDKIE